MAKSKGFGKAPKVKNSNGNNLPRQSVNLEQIHLTNTTDEALTLALQHAQAGRLPEAEQLYRQILQQQPEQPQAIHWLGVIAYQKGNLEQALAYLHRSLALNPNDANACNTLGTLLLEQDDFEHAAIYLQQAIALDPNHFMAHAALGSALGRQGKLQEALHHLHTALELNPSYPPVHISLGILLKEQGNLEQAAVHLHQAIALNANDAEAHNSLGTMLQKQGKLDEAATSYQTAITLNSNHVKAYTNLGNVLRRQGKLSESIYNFQIALALNPNDAFVHNGLGAALCEQNNLEQAIECFRRAIALNPDNADAHGNLGAALIEQGNLEQATSSLRQAISLNPNHANNHYSLAHTLLVMGDLRNGFVEYEWRWQIKEFTPRSFPQPLWDGSSLEGKTILLHAEQGLGDTIQFIRYAALVSNYGGRVVLTCSASLRLLLSTACGIEQVVSEKTLPEFQVHAPLMSLPYILGTTLETIPAQIPYLTPPAAHNLKLELLPGAKLKVGLVWASGYKQQSQDLLKNYRQRSCSLSLYIRLLSVPGISFYSLQVGHNAADIAELQEQYQLEDLSPHIHDFADTAALIDQMDLVISVDTAVAHLAGALGKPTWLLLSFAPDWRWLQNRQDSPWYPTMRLFRQQSPEDWEGVFTQVVAALRNVVDGALKPIFKLKPTRSSTNSVQNVALTLALQHYQAGRVAEAEQLYQQVLQQQPEQPDALHWLGVIAYQSGQVDNAFVCWRQSLTLNPNDANTHNSLGVGLKEQGRLGEAAIHLQQAIALNPNHFIAHMNLGNVMREQGKLQDALHYLHKASTLNPSYAPTYSSLGTVLKEQGDLEQAVSYLQQAIALDTNDADAYNSLGAILHSQAKWEAAIDSYRRAIALCPDHVMAHTNLGNTLRELGQLDEATLHLRKALTLELNNAVAHDVLGVVLMEQRSLEQATFHLQQAIALNPQSADTHYNLAHALLLMGDFQNGFTEHEWRLQMKKNWTPAAFSQPLWDGQPLEGKTILIHAEQGFGDTLQFIRYIHLVRTHGGQIILACQPPLRRLLEGIPGIKQLVEQREASRDSLPKFQVHAPLLSLPHILRTTLMTIPASVPYLVVSPRDNLNLEQLPNTRLKVGIVWASGYREQDYQSIRAYEKKSCPLSAFVKFLATPEISLYSLQVGRNAADIAELVNSYQLQDLSSKIKDFADTAALIIQMDLVISVDTAVAHLAGSLGKPVWVLLPFAADWRWLQERRDSPWYPTMRLFRQSYPQDWESVTQQIADALKAVVEGQIKPVFELESIGLNSVQPPNASFPQNSASPALEASSIALANSHNTLGMTLAEQGNLEEAVMHFQQAITLNPNNAIAYIHMGNVLREQGSLDEAISNFQIAFALNHTDTYTRAYAHNSFGTVLLDKDNLEDAAFHFRNSIALRPNNATPHYNLGHTLLAMGDFHNGFAEFEWRRQLKHAPISFPQPLWDGSNLDGKTILLHSEGGLGDTIQFIRYAPLIKARGGRVFLLCQPPLKCLLESISEIERVISPGEVLPEFQVHAPTMSLPYLFKTTLETVPSQIPYLKPPIDHSLKLESSPSSKLKVGVVWASGYRPEDADLLKIYNQKSFPLSLLTQFLPIPEISFYSLQVGHNSTDIFELGENYKLYDLSSQIKDFTDTAVLISQLDLIISVDTAVAHLAGALGKPTWLLLNFSADWRWLRKRQDSPWYPTMKLFWQPQLEDWKGVIDQITQALKNWVKTQSASRQIELCNAVLNQPKLQLITMNSETQKSMKKSIGWICDWTVDQLLGGAELTGRELVTAGQVLGYNVQEFTPQHQNLEADWLVINNVRCFALGTISQMLTGNFIYFCHDSIVLPIHQHLFSLAKHIFFYSPAQVSYYTQIFPINLDKVSLCPAPINPDNFYSSEKEEFAVSLADLGVNKGINNVIQVARENPSLRIELYGKNIMGFEPISELPHLQYKGLIPYQEVPKLLARAKFFIHQPVWLECFGRSVIEAYLSNCQLAVNQNIGALSYNWNWQDQDEVKEKLRQAPINFWSKVGEII